MEGNATRLVLGAAGGFLGRREGQKSVEFCPLGGAHQSAWSLYIVLGHTPRRRRPAGLAEQPFKTINTGGLSECLARREDKCHPGPIISE
jgi:hypothetical protein